MRPQIVSTGSEEPAGASGLDEATLVARAQDRDVAAFEELVTRYENRLYRYAYSILGNRADAEDVLQDTLLRVWRALPALTDSQAFSGWAYRITTHRCWDVLSRQRLRRTDAVDPHQMPDSADSHYGVGATGSPDPVTTTETGHQMEDLARLVQQLPPDDRACWLLREVHQRSYREIAAALSIPESTVRGRLARARQQLAKGMSSWQ
ncbi:RNA polymerase sigma factor [Corynebacterium dentalis]|uniref:RNA polymerase sigma factor n=1 Tax=Corynebacterium dentalis TaxID=2014528 RepID=UPI00289B7539|nr:RNA polymerase sigma factor [Corynebacterium dentalis]